MQNDDAIRARDQELSDLASLCHAHDALQAIMAIAREDHCDQVYDHLKELGESFHRIRHNDKRDCVRHRFGDPEVSALAAKHNSQAAVKIDWQALAHLRYMFGPLNDIDLFDANQFPEAVRRYFERGAAQSEDYRHYARHVRRPVEEHFSQLQYECGILSRQLLVVMADIRGRPDIADTIEPDLAGRVSAILDAQPEAAGAMPDNPAGVAVQSSSETPFLLTLTRAHKDLALMARALKDFTLDEAWRALFELNNPEADEESRDAAKTFSNKVFIYYLASLFRIYGENCKSLSPHLKTLVASRGIDDLAKWLGKVRDQLKNMWRVAGRDDREEALLKFYKDHAEVLRGWMHIAQGVLAEVWVRSWDELLPIYQGGAVVSMLPSKNYAIGLTLWQRLVFVMPDLNRMNLVGDAQKLAELLEKSPKRTSVVQAAAEEEKKDGADEDGQDEDVAEEEPAPAMTEEQLAKALRTYIGSLLALKGLDKALSSPGKKKPTKLAQLRERQTQERSRVSALEQAYTEALAAMRSLSEATGSTVPSELDKRVADIRGLSREDLLLLLTSISPEKPKQEEPEWWQDDKISSWLRRIGAEVQFVDNLSLLQKGPRPDERAMPEAFDRGTYLRLAAHQASACYGELLVKFREARKRHPESMLGQLPSSFERAGSRAMEKRSGMLFHNTLSLEEGQVLQVQYLDIGARLGDWEAVDSVRELEELLADHQRLTELADKHCGGDVQEARLAARLNLASAYQRMQSVKDAENSYQEALAEAGENSQWALVIMRRLSSLYWNYDEVNKLPDLLESMLLLHEQDHPDDVSGRVDLLIKRALVSKKLGDVISAGHDFQQVAEMMQSHDCYDPSHCRKLADHYADQFEHGQAETYYELALQNAGQDHQLLYEIYTARATYYREVGKHHHARVDAQIARQLLHHYQCEFIAEGSLVVEHAEKQQSGLRYDEAFGSGQYEAAGEVALDNSDSTPLSPAALYRTALLAVLKGEYERAKPVLDRLRPLLESDGGDTLPVHLRIGGYHVLAMYYQGCREEQNLGLAAQAIGNALHILENCSDPSKARLRIYEVSVNNTAALIAKDRNDWDKAWERVVVALGAAEKVCAEGYGTLDMMKCCHTAFQVLWGRGRRDAPLLYIPKIEAIAKQLCADVVSNDVLDGVCSLYLFLEREGLLSKSEMHRRLLALFMTATELEDPQSFNIAWNAINSFLGTNPSPEACLTYLEIFERLDRYIPDDRRGQVAHLYAGVYRGCYGSEIEKAGCDASAAFRYASLVMKQAALACIHYSQDESEEVVELRRQVLVLCCDIRAQWGLFLLPRGGQLAEGGVQFYDDFLQQVERLFSSSMRPTRPDGSYGAQLCSVGLGSADVPHYQLCRATAKFFCEFYMAGTVEFLEGEGGLFMFKVKPEGAEFFDLRRQVEHEMMVHAESRIGSRLSS